MLWIDQKYLNLLSPKLERFKRKSDNLYNCRCPICGDSKKNKFKARGYIYDVKNSLAYKCHNCGFSGGLGKLIEQVDPHLHNQYKLERFKERGHRTSNTETKFTYKPDFSEYNKKDPLDNVKRIKDLEFNSNPVQYIVKRQIPMEIARELYYVDNIQKLEDLFPEYKNRLIGKEERILIPCYTRDKKLIGLTCRGINNDRLRYVTIKAIKDHPLVFGLDKVNINKNIYVLEGPIDSMFVDNSISVGGSDFKRIANFAAKDMYTMVYDNQPRNKELLSIMERSIDDGYKVVIWPEHIKEKDINEMILAGMSKEEVFHIINSNAYKNLAAKAKLKEWRKINA